VLQRPAHVAEVRGGTQQVTVSPKNVLSRRAPRREVQGAARDDLNILDRLVVTAREHRLGDGSHRPGRRVMNDQQPSHSAITPPRRSTTSGSRRQTTRKGLKAGSFRSGTSCRRRLVSIDVDPRTLSLWPAPLPCLPRGGHADPVHLPAVGRVRLTTSRRSRNFLGNAFRAGLAEREHGSGLWRGFRCGLPIRCWCAMGPPGERSS
jgi:hypothetical protein